jgi:hypothetical protein
MLGAAELKESKGTGKIYYGKRLMLLDLGLISNLMH